MKKKDIMKPIDDAINGIVKKHKKTFAEKWELVKNSKGKKCDTCARNLDDWKEGLGEKIMDNEYIVMQSIEAGKEGNVSLTCNICLEKMYKTPIGGQGYMPN